MNQNLKRFFSIAALLCTITIIADCGNNCSVCPCGCTNSQNLWQPHAFSVSAARNLMLEKNAWTPMDDEESWHGMFGVGLEYQSNRHVDCNPKVFSNCKNLGSMPFWSTAHGETSDDNEPTFSNRMTIGDNSGAYDLDVYQMGMGPVTTNGFVQLNPQVFQTGADFLIYAGVHRSERGFWLRAHGPVGVINVKPVLTYSSDEPVAVPYPAGALDAVSKGPINAPYENIAQAFDGQSDAGFLRKMTKGRIECKRTSSAQFGDIEFSVGYNVYADEEKHFGIALTFSAPTGNKADGRFVLEPIFGRNGHWGAGASILSHYRFWESDKDDRWIDLWFDGTVLHLFRSKHCRSFDLCANGPGSKYLLVAKYAGTTFQNSIQNAVNITTIGIESTFAAEGNFALAFDFHWCNWSFLIGYEGWGRTCEKICLDCSCPGATDYSEYAVLGRQTPFCDASLNPQCDGNCINNLSEPLAQIGKSQNRVTVCTGDTLPEGIVDATNVSNRLPEDAADALNIHGQRAHAAYTSKPFLQVQHTWMDSDFSPFLAFSGGYEFSNLKNSAISLWNVGIQGGIAF
ncbi:MAG TPA: hypothetical protein VLG50_03410 [Candidatus Saccharimonadales bacterium]|nr:hypothetical protein [Candidatus Saccharimonadales bacterium]